MDPNTIKTVNDFFSLAGRIILYCGGIAGALAGIWAFVGKIKSKGWRAATDVRIANLEDYSRKDNERLKKLEAENIDKAEEFADFHEIMRLNLNASQQLLKSNLEGGNNKAGMQRASDEIQEYLRSKV
jgi:hypothetical protein